LIKKILRWYTIPNIVRGMLIYSAGDTVACLIAGNFSISRFAGMVLVGGIIYAAEIPNYFNWINKKVADNKKTIDQIKRTLLAIVYFNPLWIARHLLFINIFTGNYSSIEFGLLHIGLLSFAFNIPVSLTANWVIQNYINAKYRFIASAGFSALMAIYYSLSEVIFR